MMATICFFNTTDSWGGGEKWHLETCNYMHQKGYKVLFVCNQDSELSKRLCTTQIPYVEVQLSNLSFINPLKVKGIQQIFTKHKVETLLMNLSRDVKAAGLAAKKAGVVHIIYRRGSAIPIKNSFLNRYYFKNIITAILANSEATKTTVLANNPNLFPKEKITVIYNGIDIEGFLDKAYSPVYSKTEDELVLVNLGRLEFQKNQKFLIHLAAELKQRGLNFKIVIGGDGRLKEELQALAQTLAVSDFILFPGFIQNPKDLMYGGDIFVLSSLWEGFGYVLAEAALCKKPTIAFDISSNPEVVIDGKTGFLTPVDNVKAFADKVQFYHKNKQQIADMGAAAFNFAKATFDSKGILHQIEQYILNPITVPKISALLITYNESHNIREFLAHLHFVDEIIVVDSFSTDGTAELIKEFPKVTLIQRKFKNYTDQKSFALSQANNDWVLFLDADERLTPKLKKEIINAVSLDNQTAAYYFYRKFMFKDRILHFSGSQNDKNYRLFRKSRVHFNTDRIVHETLVVDGKSKVLKHPLIHYCYRTYEEYKGKMIKYGQMKAVDELKKNYRPNIYHFMIKPAYKFIYNFVIRLGFLDGKKGAIISYLSALGVSERYKELKKLQNEKK